MKLNHHLLSFVLLFWTQCLMAQTDSTKTDSLNQQQRNNVANPAAETTIQRPVSANPDISVIGDFRGLFKSYGTDNIDAGLKEAEFSFQSVVDPYARADFYYAVEQDLSSGEFEGEIEEGFLTTLSLPANLQLKAGRFKQAVGKINSQHSHALPFINMPDAYVSFFGDEGLKGDGISLSWLLPNQTFYQELTVQATEPVNSHHLFQRSNKNDFLLLAHLKNFWDLNSNSTLELGLTGMRGENTFQKITTLASIDFTYKWKPVQFNTYKSITFQNELYFSQSNTFLSSYNSFGFYSLLNLQISKRWFVGGRFDYTEAPYDTHFIRQSVTGTLGWYATEFQKIEVEGKIIDVNKHVAGYAGELNPAEIFLRWVFVIGTHGAHQY